MKKIFLFPSFLLAASFAVFAYTQTDLDSAIYLSNNSIITKQSTASGYRLDDKITRAEVMGTALKMKWIPLPEGYICKKQFSDATANDWICRAAELAAEHGLISSTNTKARPSDSITRAEAFAILFKTKTLPATSIPGEPSFGDQGIVDWQKSLFKNIVSAHVSIPGVITTEGEWAQIFFYPNRVATRAEVFTFAKNVLDTYAIMSGEVNIQF